MEKVWAFEDAFANEVPVCQNMQVFARMRAHTCTHTHSVNVGVTPCNESGLDKYL
jgi:hypothetical protein